MKLSKNQKIIGGVIIGGAIAYGLYRIFMKDGSENLPTTEDKALDTPLTRQEKIEYIIDNVGVSSKDEQSGFNGDRFVYDPTIGYSLPVGTIQETNSGGEMVISHEGNLANTIFFNAEGRKTADPTDEAEAILNELSDEQVDITYNVVKAGEMNPDLSIKDIVGQLGYDNAPNSVFGREINPKIQDVKALKKTTTWASSWKAKMLKRGNKANEKKNLRLIEKVEQRFNRALGLGKKRGVRKGTAMRPKRGAFANEVVNRESGRLWGGHRSDGKPIIPVPPHPTLSNKDKQKACKIKCELTHPFNKKKRLACKDVCFSKFPV